MNQLKSVANSIDIDRIIKEHKGFKTILIVIEDAIYHRFKKSYPQEFDSMTFDELWGQIEEVSKDLLIDKVLRE